MKKSLSLIGLLSATVLLSAPSLAVADGGRVTIAKGEPKVQRGSMELNATRSTPLLVGDTVVTPLDSGVQWWMDDDSMIAQGRSSQVTIEQHSNASRVAQYRLNGGGVRIVSGLNKPVVNATAAKIEALGTDFSAFACTAGLCGNRAGLYVRVSTGRVRVGNSGGSIEAGAPSIVFVASPSTAPIIIVNAPSVVLSFFAQLEFDSLTFDFNTEINSVPVLSGGGTIVIPTPTPTATPTSTATPTGTPVPTPTDTSVPTATPTGTPVPTPTGTPVPTPTGTPGPTPTATATPTGTAQPTPPTETPGSPS